MSTIVTENEITSQNSNNNLVDYIIKTLANKTTPPLFELHDFLLNKHNAADFHYIGEIHNIEGFDIEQKQFYQVLTSDKKEIDDVDIQQNVLYLLFAKSQLRVKFLDDDFNFIKPYQLFASDIDQEKIPLLQVSPIQISDIVNATKQLSITVKNQLSSQIENLKLIVELNSTNIIGNLNINVNELREKLNTALIAFDAFDRLPPLIFDEDLLQPYITNTVNKLNLDNYLNLATPQNILIFEQTFNLSGEELKTFTVPITLPFIAGYYIYTVKLLQNNQVIRSTMVNAIVHDFNVSIQVERLNYIVYPKSVINIPIRISNDSANIIQNLQLKVTDSNQNLIAIQPIQTLNPFSNVNFNISHETYEITGQYQLVASVVYLPLNLTIATTTITVRNNPFRVTIAVPNNIDTYIQNQIIVPITIFAHETNVPVKVDIQLINQATQGIIQTISRIVDEPNVYSQNVSFLAPSTAGILRVICNFRLNGILIETRQILINIYQYNITLQVPITNYTVTAGQEITIQYTIFNNLHLNIQQPIVIAFTDLVQNVNVTKSYNGLNSMTSINDSITVTMEQLSNIQKDYQLKVLIAGNEIVTRFINVRYV